MTSPISPQNSNVPSVSSTAPSAADPATAGAAMSTNASGEATGATKISSLADLKNKAPKVYYQMMLGLATSVISDMRTHQDRLKDMQQKARDEANG